MENSRLLRTLYLELMKNVLTRYIAGAEYIPVRPNKILNRRVWWSLFPLAYPLMRKLFDIYRIDLCHHIPFDPVQREHGADQPADAETMVGLKRLGNIQYCLDKVIREEVPGDFIETGVWRGGACIFARAVLAAYGDTSRRIWVADSFEGLPRPNVETYPEDAGSFLWKQPRLAITLDEVKQNFARYQLLDAQVRFLKGWFKDTLAEAPIEKIAVMRLDGDMYESTTDALKALYPKLSVGGFCIIDDYGCIPACKQAVIDFRSAHNIMDEITEIDWTGVYWRRSG